MSKHLLHIYQINFLAVFALLVSCGIKAEENDVLWYDSPANNWEEALPLGNGKLGVMVFGQTVTERLQLNDDSMWPGKAGWDEPEGNAGDIQKMRQMLFEGKNDLADKLFVDKFSRKGIVRSHQTLGDLHIGLNHENITDYRRELNLNDAISLVSYKTNGYGFTQSVFVSHPHKAIIIELTTEAPEGLNGELRLSRPFDDGHPTVQVKTTDGKTLVMQGEVTQRTAKFESMLAPILEGVKFETLLRVNNQGGEIIRGENSLHLSKVKKVTILIVSNSSFYYDDYAGQNKIDLAILLKKKIKNLKKEHTGDHQKFYNRVKFNLNEDNLDAIPTDKRLQRVKEGATDLGLETLLFHYGRYLLIASSREGTNPANLQGLWNQEIVAPWNADYHLNINLQMNYWLANLTALDELNYPLFDYVDKLVENGKVTARKNFGCSGSFIPHASDIWAPTWMRSPTAFWGSSMGAGGWMMQHYWQHFLFTGDTAFLKTRVYPAIKEVAKFYSDWIIEDPRDGTLISAPSTSPENRFINAAGNPVATCLGSAKDQQVIAEVFSNFLKTCEILNIKDSLTEKILQQSHRLRPGMVIGSDGRILEWDREYKESEPGHRHISHIYAFHPGNSVSKDNNPEIFKAVRKTLDYRLEKGGAGTGWSRAWLINCSARLLDGEMAHENILLLLKKSMYKNLFDAHPPFQIDGNFGYTAGVAEMLLQSHEENKIRILPALPSAWKNGYIEGIKARNGITVDIYWANYTLTKVVFKSKIKNTIQVIYKDQASEIVLIPGEAFIYKPLSN